MKRWARRHGTAAGGACAGEQPKEPDPQGRANEVNAKQQDQRGGVAVEGAGQNTYPYTDEVESQLREGAKDRCERAGCESTRR